MNRGISGYKLPISAVAEPCDAFIPNPLSPAPPVIWSAPLFSGQVFPLGGCVGWWPNWVLPSPTANAAIFQLVRLGIVEGITGRQRSRVYAYKDYLRILGEGTEPAAP
jgi:hypothetical protein